MTRCLIHTYILRIHFQSLFIIIATFIFFFIIIKKHIEIFTIIWLNLYQLYSSNHFFRNFFFCSITRFFVFAITSAKYRWLFRSLPKIVFPIVYFLSRFIFQLSFFLPPTDAIITPIEWWPVLAAQRIDTSFWCKKNINRSKKYGCKILMFRLTRWPTNHAHRTGSYLAIERERLFVSSNCACPPTANGQCSCPYKENTKFCSDSQADTDKSHQKLIHHRVFFYQSPIFDQAEKRVSAHPYMIFTRVVSLSCWKK